jgi:hypothetical protein
MANGKWQMAENERRKICADCEDSAGEQCKERIDLKNRPFLCELCELWRLMV